MADSSKQKVKLENTVFSKFKADNNKLSELKYAVTALNEGFNGMNFFLTKFVDVNARSAVNFSRATCTTAELQPSDKYVAASVFQHGIDVLEQYINTEDEIKLPADVRQQNALGLLLAFLTEDHDEFIEIQKNSLQQEKGELAYNLLEHLLIKLAVEDEFVITDSYPGMILPPEEIRGYIGDTSFGCEKGWHGSVDILLENNLPIQLIKPTQPYDQPESSASSTETNSSNHFSDSHQSQLIAPTIVYSFLQHKYNKSELKNVLVPTIGICHPHVYVNLYDCENDIFLASEKTWKILSGRKLYDEIIVLLWLVLNYKYFCSGICEEMRYCKADFHRRVDDLLCEYRDNVKMHVHVSTKKRDNSELDSVHGRKGKKLCNQIEYVYGI